MIKILLIFIAIPLLSSLGFSNATIQDTSCIESEVDFDGDGIINSLEESGIDINKDNVTDLNLSNISDPLHKDIFVELDYMQNHMPNQTGMNDVVKVFKDAPVCNPDGQNGINLHIFVDDVVPHDSVTSIECSEGKNVLFSEPSTENLGDNWTEVQNIKKDYFGTIKERADDNSINILDAKGSIYYYGIFIHQIKNVPDSGCAHDKERLFVVSLGNESWWQLDDVIGKDPHTNDTKSDANFHARSLMHEMGHTLGLVHGGNSSLNDLNYKPNYLSVMNYLYLFPDAKMENVSFLDYSGCALPDINEVMTNYSKGIDIGNCSDFVENEIIWVGHHDYNNNTAKCLPDTATKFNTPVNWTQNTSPGSIFTDINCDGSEEDVLRGFNDWENLKYLR
jgi:hypothetical protein